MAMDQQKMSKIAQELLTSEKDELDGKEVEWLNERATFVQQVSQIDSQIQALEKQVEGLRDQRSRFLGVAEYIMSNAITYRASKAASTREAGGPSKDKSDQKIRPIVQDEQETKEVPGKVSEKAEGEAIKGAA